MALLQEQLPELYAEYGDLYLPEYGPPAAFRLLTIKEINGFLQSMHAGDFWVSRGIVKRALLFPALDEYRRARAGDYYQAAMDVFMVSALGDENKISDAIAASREHLDEWGQAMMFLARKHLSLSDDDINRLTYKDLMVIVAGLEAHLNTTLDPVQLSKQTKKPDKIDRARKAHERYEQLRKQQQAAVEKRPDGRDKKVVTNETPGPGIQEDMEDGKYVIRGTEEMLGQGRAELRQQRWQNLMQGMDDMENRGGDPAKLKLSSIYKEDREIEKINQTSLGMSASALNTLPLDIAAVTKHLREQGSNTGVDFDKMTYLGE